MQRESEHLRLLTSSHGLDGYAVFDIGHQVESKIYPKIGLTNLSAKLVEQIVALEEQQNLSLFRMLATTSGPFRWLVGIDTVTGTRLGRTIADEALDGLLEPQDFVGGYCIAAQVPGKRRCAVVYFKKREKPKSRYPDLVLDTIELIDNELATSIADDDQDLPMLSASERNCLVWCACGKTSGEIGKILSLSEHTVNHYFSLAGQKLGTLNRVHTVSKAIQLGLIDLSELT
ncbi:MAG: helix-turn-helix transcriptional regulator [Rhizobiaceae bacterium]